MVYIEFISMRCLFGFTLIEILISLFLLSIMLLGLDAAELVSLRDARNAFYFQTASQQVWSFVEAMRVHQGRDESALLTEWNRKNQIALPQGEGRLMGHYPAYQVNLYWGADPHEDCQHHRTGNSGCVTVTINEAVSLDSR